MPIRNVVPNAGTMVLFRSWLCHSVKPTKGKEERISVVQSHHVSGRRRAMRRRDRLYLMLTMKGLTLLAARSKAERPV